MRVTDGWESDGLGLDEGLFGGAARVGTFSDPSMPAAAETEAGAADPAPEAQSAAVVAAAAPPTSSAVGPLAGTSPTADPPLDDPLRAARAVLLGGDAQVAEPAQWGARAVLRRSTGGLLRPGAGKAERAYNADLDTIRTFQWPGPFSVLVANKKGGVGKTPTTLLVAGVLAQVRGGGVVAFEGAEAAGTLAMRAEGAGAATRGLTELLHAISQKTVRNAASLAWFTQLQSSGAMVIGSVNDRDTLGEIHVRAIRQLLDQYYPISVVDTGNDPESPAFLECVDGAAALVLPTVLTPSSVIALIDSLSRVRDDGPHGARLAETAVIVVTDDGRPTDPKRAAELRELLNVLGAGAVVDVPHDPHIAAGNEISLGRLSVASQRAWVHATAQALACANRTTYEGTI